MHSAADDQPPLVRIVRHGQSTFNVAGMFQGHDDSAVLTQVGLAEAEATGRTLARRPVAAIVCSDLQRARRTAEKIATHVHRVPTADARLRERSLGDLELRPLSVGRPEQLGVRGTLVTDADARPHGGESLRELSARIAGFVVDLLPGGRYAPTETGDLVLVTHGGVVRVLLALAAGARVEEMEWPVVANASVTDLSLADLADLSLADLAAPLAPPTRAPSAMTLGRGGDQ